MNNFLDTLKQLGVARLLVMGGVLVGLLLFFIFVSMRVSAPNMKLLYDNLSSADSSAIAAKLESAHIAYDITEDGTKVTVNNADVARARMLLAEEGLPGSGSMGYEIFDKQAGFGTTNFMQNINQVRALEGELARTIGSLKSIKSSRVHLVLPQRELFSRESRPASASVLVTLNGNAHLSDEEVASIQSLVASAVPGLKAQNVSVIDSNGNLLARGGNDADPGLQTAKSEEMRQNYELRLTQSVEDMVGRIVGFGHVRASVTADLNFDRISTNEEMFDPNGQVLRSSQTSEEKNTERSSPSGNVSVQNNLPGSNSDLLVDPKPAVENNKTEETTNYEISKTVRSMVREVGEVNKLSVAVLVDGVYQTDDKGVKTYQPRKQEEIDQIKDLVKSAIGYDEKRGDTIEVVNMQFADLGSDSDLTADDRIFGFERSDLIDAATTISVAIMAILVVLLVLQPMVGRLLETGAAMDDPLENELLSAGAPNPALEAPGGEFSTPIVQEEEESLIDMTRVEGKVKASSIKKVEDIVNNYPQETISVIRNWMTQET